MSRKHRHAIDESSLETLLDTVCNTLGVVVFICILLVLQINDASPHAGEAPPTPESSAALNERQQKIAASREQVEQLQAAAAQTKGVTARFSNAESQRLAARLRQQSRDQTQRVFQKQQTMSTIAQAQQAANEAARQLSSQTQTLEELREQVAAIDQKLKSEIQRRSTTSSFPEGRESQKEMIGIILKGGVMYRVHVMNPSRTFNTGEVQSLKEPAGEFLEPVPGSGLRINPQSPNMPEIVQRLGGYSKTSNVLRVFFWPDSFAEFQVLRNALVQESLPYAPEPVPEKTRIQTGGQASAVFEQ